MVPYGKHLEGGEHCTFTRVVETRNKGLRTIANNLGVVIKKIFVPESEFSISQQSGWIEKENHRTVLVGFNSGKDTAFSMVKKSRVTVNV